MSSTKKPFDMYHLAKKAVQPFVISREKRLSNEIPYSYGFDGMRCRLCRFRQTSTMSFSKDRERCKSCAMSPRAPKWVDLSDEKLYGWIGAMTEKSFAKMLGCALCRLRVIESAPKVNRKTASKIATALTLGASYGTDLGQLAQDWPLFHTLVDVHAVYGATDGEVLAVLDGSERSERSQHLFEERGTEADRPPPEGE